jgi:hypothetical protein
VRLLFWLAAAAAAAAPGSGCGGFLRRLAAAAVAACGGGGCGSCCGCLELVCALFVGYVSLLVQLRALALAENVLQLA